MYRVFTYIWVPETKAVPIECMEGLFSGKMRNAAWRSKRLFPPQGIPPVPESLAAGQAAYIRANKAASSRDEVDEKLDRAEIEHV
jgi:hypothetical protein